MRTAAAGPTGRNSRPIPRRDAGIWPQELQRNDFLRRRGNAFDRPQWEQEAAGDFFTLKELVTDYSEVTAERGLYYPVRDTLIRAYQYLIARYDVDGYRIDTLKYIEPEFARVFGNAIREYAQSIGKRNFFTFGEVYDDEQKIAGFIGRQALEPGDLTGVDAALDFPLFYDLPGVAKGHAAAERGQRCVRAAPAGGARDHQLPRRGQPLLRDLPRQPRPAQPLLLQRPGRPGPLRCQLTLGVACLFALQGIPCLYYGTEQGLHGAGDSPEAVREALWGKPNAFDREHPFYPGDASAVRRCAPSQPALRYGRQYFRPISGDGVHFGLSTFPQWGAGLLAHPERPGGRRGRQHRLGRGVARRCDRRLRAQSGQDALRVAVQQQIGRTER